MTQNNGIFILGFSACYFPATETPNQPQMQRVDVCYPIENVDSPKFKRIGSGYTSEVPRDKAPLIMNEAYMKELVEKRAFVPRKDYEIVMGFNPDSMSSEVMKLIPVDADVKQHFKDMGMK